MSRYMQFSSHRHPKVTVDGQPSVGGMDAAVARDIAHATHRYSRTRSGEFVIEHVARVAAHVPREAQATAWLHDVLEQHPPMLDELRAQGLSMTEEQALALLTRADDEAYEVYALRVAHAPGPAGRLARIVKLADLDDNMARPWVSGDPPFAWARRHVDGAVRVD